MAATINRVWAMPNKWTFNIAPIRELLGRYMQGGVWVDPMMGMTQLQVQAEVTLVTNDLNPESPAGSHLRALGFLTRQDTASADGVLFDPPYSIHQVKISYDKYGLDVKENITGGFPKEKWQVARILKAGGLAISFGWNTVGMGMKRGFEAIEYLVVSHGGNRNDTLVTVERRVSE